VAKNSQPGAASWRFYMSTVETSRWFDCHKNQRILTWFESVLFLFLFHSLQLAIFSCDNFLSKGTIRQSFVAGEEAGGSASFGIDLIIWQALLTEKRTSRRGDNFTPPSVGDNYCSWWWRL